MTVHKLDFDSIKQRRKGFTTHLNDVLQNINDGFVLGVYCYLSSLPESWKVNKEHLMKHFDVGREKIEKTLSQLNDLYLITYDRKRNEKGHISSVAIIVEDGWEFVEKIINNKMHTSTPRESRIVVCTTPRENQALEKPEPGKPVPIYNKYKDINKTKDINKSSCASNDAHSQNEQSYFDRFWETYPRKVNKLRSKKIWDRKKLNQHHEKIISDIEQRLSNDHQWRDEQFIPHPSTYLMNERWHDEIILHKEKPKKETQQEMINRVLGNIGASNQGAVL